MIYKIVMNQIYNPFKFYKRVDEKKMIKSHSLGSYHYQVFIEYSINNYVLFIFI